jgi:hypothetical protein
VVRLEPWSSARIAIVPRDALGQTLPVAAFLALAQGKGPAAPAVKILEYKEMKPFFVAGDSDAP